MKRNPFRWFLVWFLAFLMLCSCIPVQAAAAGKLPLPQMLDLIDFSSLPEDLSPGELLAILALLDDQKETGSQETVPEEYRPAPAEMLSPDFQLYFGQLHAHTDISDGTGTVEDAFQYAARVEGLDFFAVTDHSDSFEGALQGSILTDGAAVSSDWAAGKAAAAAVTGDRFVGIYAYEMSWPGRMQIGHIGTFNTPGFQSWQQEPYDKYLGALEEYYAALASVPGAVGQFNHPGSQYGSFSEFSRYSPDADRVMNLLEIGDNLPEAYDYYIKALDQGWHVAPANNQALHSSHWEDTGARTVVCAPSLTEEALYEAMRNCRAYATEDPDLEILYTMDGHFMGSRLDMGDFGETAQISVTLSDPTDAAVGTVEIVTFGGVSLGSKYLFDASGTLTFSLTPEPGYYFLRITQPDGDTAVTAPIWIEGEEALGITNLTCETEIPVQNEPVILTAELENAENAPFLVEAVDVLADGKPAVVSSSLTELPANSAKTHTLSFFCDSVGQTEIRLRISGTLRGEKRSLEAAMTLNFHQSGQITAIAVDASHGNAGLGELTALTKAALEQNIRTAFFPEEPGYEDLKDCRFFLISAPSLPFSEDFLAVVKEYVAQGGTLILCGQADLLDGSLSSAGELNRLLKTLDASLELRDDVVLDPVHNDGSPELLHTNRFDQSSSWWADLSEGQVYAHSLGCSVSGGSALVTGRPTALSMDGDGDGLGGEATETVTLLAVEEQESGGSIFATGSLFCNDSGMAEPQNIWDAPYANRTLALTLLGIGGETVPLSTIRQARLGAKNELFRVRGYVTAGTSNPYNTFPETIYLQDDTGGIAVIPFPESGIQAGTAMEVTGYAVEKGGNRCLKLSAWKVLDTPMYLYEGITGSWDYLLDPALCGGVLVQVEGTCLEVYCREDGTLAGCLLKDEQNRLAQVKIEDYIFAGSDGKNDLHKTIRRGRTVRAMGILHIDEYGDPVIRVRNCEEVVWVPPLRLLNPDTGDISLGPAAMAMALSLMGLVLLRKKKK